MAVGVEDPEVPGQQFIVVVRERCIVGHFLESNWVFFLGRGLEGVHMSLE